MRLLRLPKIPAFDGEFPRATRRSDGLTVVAISCDTRFPDFFSTGFCAAAFEKFELEAGGGWQLQGASSDLASRVLGDFVCGLCRPLAHGWLAAIYKHFSVSSGGDVGDFESNGDRGAGGVGCQGDKCGEGAADKKYFHRDKDS